MKTKLFYFTVILLFVFQYVTLAQERRVLFLHGYASDAATAWTGSKVGNIPQDWVSEGIISANAYHTPTIINFVDTMEILRKLEIEFVSAPADAKWILVGHSLGGLIARASEPSIKANNINLKGIITLGTPHQGAPVANAVLNTAYAQSVANQVRDNILAGPAWQGDYGWIGDPVGMIYSIYDLVGNVQIYKKLSTALGDAHTTLTSYITEASANHAEYLAPNSSFMYNRVLSVTSNVPHISISGVESSPHTFIRFVSALNDVGPTLGNENEAVQKIVDGIVIYKFAEDYHALYDRWWLKYNPMTYHVWLMHHEGMIHWRYGREALQNLDIKWAEMHNEVLSYTQTGSYDYWVDCTGGGIFYPSYHDLETMFRTVEQYQCDNGLIEGYWATRYYTYTVYYQDQTDGFIPKKRTVWKSGESITDNPSTTSVSAIRQGNISFDGANEADGGYNHLELRFHKRDNGSATPTRSTPNRFAQDWAKEWFGVN